MKHGKHPYALIAAFLAIMCCFGHPAVFAAESEGRLAPSRPWSVSFQTKYFANSHTSYEFGNPFPPYQAPLSRLEFPLDSWWTGASLRREFSRFSAGLEVWRNLSRTAKGAMADSDWDDEAHPFLKTIYSESSCRMEPSYIVRGDVDLKISDWLGLPRWFDLRPTAGVTWQRFSLVTENGLQYQFTDGYNIETDFLPGEGIRFEQTYWQFRAGLKAAFDLGKPFHLPGLKLVTQTDAAYVEAKNEDYHLLRTGKRLTLDKTTGWAWQASADLKIGLAQNLAANIGAQYQYITTTGTHRLFNEMFEIDFSFDHGVRVWSEQLSFNMGIEYLF